MCYVTANVDVSDTNNEHDSPHEAILSIDCFDVLSEAPATITDDGAMSSE